MIKILFLINTLGGGGAERVLVNLVNNMDKTKFDITVETMFAGGVNRGLLDKDIKYFCKNKLGIKGLSKIIKYIPAKILYSYYIGNKDYDIIVAYMHGAPTKVISGCNNSKIKKVTWLHYGDPKKGTFFDYWVNEKKAINAYEKLDAIVGVSQSVSNAFSQYTKFKENIVTLYNTNDTKKIIDMAHEDIDIKIDKMYPLFCCAGRLVSQKGFDRLINVTSRLKDEELKFRIIIMGLGPEEKKLKQLILDKDVSDYIKLVGFCNNPYSVMKKSDYFILSSREEGLATVITEAITLGLPVVATDVSGVQEVLGNNNEYGLVVENSEDGIYEGLKKFLKNKELTEKYRSIAKERAKKFDTKHTVKATEDFFKNLLK